MLLHAKTVPSNEIDYETDDRENSWDPWQRDMWTSDFNSVNIHCKYHHEHYRVSQTSNLCQIFDFLNIFKVYARLYRLAKFQVQIWPNFCTNANSNLAENVLSPKGELSKYSISRMHTSHPNQVFPYTAFAQCSDCGVEPQMRGQTRLLPLRVNAKSPAPIAGSDPPFLLLQICRVRPCMRGLTLLFLCV